MFECSDLDDEHFLIEIGNKKVEVLADVSLLKNS